MKVLDKRNEESVRLCDCDPGDIVQIGDNYYIVTDDNSQSGYTLVVDLKRGELDGIINSIQVRKSIAEVHIVG